MFQTLELQYLKKLSKGNQIGDFSSPEAFHPVKVERLGSDPVKSSAEGSGKFPMPISTLVSEFPIDSRESSNRTPPIVRTFNFSAQSLVEFSQFVQRMLQGLRVLYLFTSVQSQVGFHTEVYPYTFTRSGQDFFSRIIGNNIKPKRSDSISTDLDIADITVPIAMLMIQDIATFEHKLFFHRTPLLEGQTDKALFKFVACFELRRTVFSSLFELRGTDTSATLTISKPSEKSFVGNMDTDYHSVKRVTRYPRPVLLGPLEQLRQVRLQAIPTSILSIDAVISLLQSKEVVMHITQVIKQVAHAHVLRVVTYLIFLRSHGATNYQSLTPFKWVGNRHVTLRLRLNCLPTGMERV